MVNRYSGNSWLLVSNIGVLIVFDQQVTNILRFDFNGISLLVYSLLIGESSEFRP